MPRKKEIKVHETTLAVDADLSEASYAQASENLKDLYLRKGPDFGRQYSVHDIFDYQPKLLTVSYFNVDTALALMAKYRDCDVKVVQYYNIDEWTLEVLPTGANDIYRLHSPGA